MDLGTLTDSPDVTQTHAGGILQRTWSLSSLTVLERFLRQAILSLIEASRSKHMYAWMPHPWLQLTGRRRELLFQQALRAADAHISMVIGGRTMLDRALLNTWPSDIFSVTTNLSPFQDQQAFHFHVVDEYLLLTQMDRHTATAISKLFDHRTTPEDVPPSQLREVIQAKAAISLTLVRDPIEADKLRAKFLAFLKKQ